jgi:hypothetical protein
MVLNENETADALRRACLRKAAKHMDVTATEAMLWIAKSWRDNPVTTL